MDNSQIASLFEETADLLEIRGDNPFRVRSYRNAARTIKDLTERLADLVEEGKDLEDLPGIGEGHAGKIKQIIETGHLERLDELRQKVPGHLRDLLGIEGLGPKRVEQLHRELGIQDLEGLKKAAREGKIADLEGLGKKTQEKMLAGIESLSRSAGRMGLKAARDHVEDLGRELDKLDSLKRWVVAGSFRRRRETIGDLDVLIEARDRKQAASQLTGLPGIQKVLGRGQEKVSIQREGGLRIDFRFFDQSAFGAAWMYFTGSKAHNVALRKRAQESNYKLNEYGLFSGDRLVAGKTEKAVYHKLGLSWIPPELREDRGEIDRAAGDDLPRLIERKHIRGDLHAHSDATDGRSSLEEMAGAARQRGYEYLAITDHSRSLTVAKGLDPRRLRRQADRIRKLDSKLDDLWLLAGIEVDILEDGKLDLPGKVLGELDWVVGSVHSHFRQGPRRMTERIVRAISSGSIHCLGHPFGRLLGKRDPLEFDLDRVLEACAEAGVCLELNAHPDRLDLPDTACQRARQAGVPVVIVTDAHVTSDLDLIDFGVWTARRGWLGRREVLNTLGASALRKRL